MTRPIVSHAIQKTKELALDSFAFFIFSAIIMTPIGLFGGAYERAATSIFMESVAPMSTTGLFVFSIMSAALVMFFFGRHRPDRKLNDFVYKHIVRKVTQFGMSFAAAGAGMLAGLSAAAAIDGEHNVTIVALVTAVIFICYWCFFSIIYYYASEGFGASIDSKMARAMLLLAFLGAPALYIYLYEPVNECDRKESAAKQSPQDSPDESNLL